MAESESNPITPIPQKWETKLQNWNPDGFSEITTVDMHTAGEPLRVIVSGYPEIQGDTILAKRKWARENADNLRKILMYEPRGHADMYGCLVVEPESDDSDFGVLFMHNEGYSTMCGHAIIAISKLVVETKFVSVSEPETRIKIDTPAGQVQATAIVENGKVNQVSFQNVPSFVLHRNQTVTSPYGDIQLDIAFGGAFYAYVDAQQLDLNLSPENFSEIVTMGKSLKKLVAEQIGKKIKHPTHDDLSFLYGVIFTGPPACVTHHSRHVCVFADGEVDRSPTGTGVSGRVAILCESENLPLNTPVTIESILGTTFQVSASKRVNYVGLDAVIPQVTGNASITGLHRFLIDHADKTGQGFILR